MRERATPFARRGSRQAVRDGLFVMAAADIGLILFMLGLGQMRVAEGIWGPLLLIVATAAFVWSRRPRARLGSKEESRTR